jgi:hypothetical protein
MDYEGIIRFSFDWLKTKESLKVLLPYTAFAAVITFIGLFFQKPTFFFSWPNLVFFVVFEAVVILVSVFFYCLAISFGLKRSKNSNLKIGEKEYFGLIKTMIIVFLRTLFYCHSKKLRTVQWIGLIVPIVSLVLMAAFSVMGNVIAMILFLLVFLAAFLAYLVVVIYSAIRYSVADVVFFDRKIDAGKAVDYSWNLTRGSVVEITAASFVAYLIMMIVFGIAAFILAIPVSAAGLLAGNDIANLFSLFFIIMSFFYEMLVFLPGSFIKIGIYNSLHCTAKK